MTNFKTKMRKVATIVACLAVTTMFASCDKKNGDDDGNGNGKGRTLTAEEKKLVGDWYRGNISGGKYNSNTGVYLGFTGIGVFQTFNADGTYYYHVISRSITLNMDMALKGDWCVKNGNIVKTKIKVSRSEDLGKTWSQWVASTEPELTQKYELGTDSSGEYLIVNEEMPFRRSN